MLERVETKSARIEVIDVLRGFTLLGIAFVHFTEQYYAGMYPQGRMHEMNVADSIVREFINILISGKFFMIFSFLFGLSFFLQLNKSDASGRFVLRFTWRLLILFMTDQETNSQYSVNGEDVSAIVEAMHKANQK